MSEQHNDQTQREHPFDRMMFGDRRPRNQEAAQIETNQPTEEQPTSSQNYDITSMMQNVDQIMTSFRQFKPLMKQFSPLLDLFKSKK
ncbi:hypothetical protein ACFSCX_01850 [Bacillus salitolerans]|uniref:Spore coat protein n=1 Tax=Bacillus salitolerans TaxID=1437434 RepID=A0ABW4LMT4_9BACI